MTLASSGISKEMLSEIALRSAEELAVPPSDREARTLAELSELPRVIITRPPAEGLLAAGMVLHNCHSNCASQAANDPQQATRHVWGWWIYGPTVVLHSVVEMAGTWLCLTPQARRLPPRFQFIPDTAIEWRASTDGLSTNPIATAFRFQTRSESIPSGILRCWTNWFVSWRRECQRTMHGRQLMPPRALT